MKQKDSFMPLALITIFIIAPMMGWAWGSTVGCVAALVGLTFIIYELATGNTKFLG